MLFRVIFAFSLLIPLVGCSSISSTMLNRLEDDHFVGNSNGEAKPHCMVRPFDGIPITLRVPTHVDVAIEEKVRFSLDQNEQQMYRLQSEPTHRHLSVHPKLIYTDKVFTVDVKRPAAGTANYSFEFGENDSDLDNRQYFASLKSRIADETIRDVTTAIDTVFGAISAAPAAQQRRSTQPDDVIFFDQTRTVAWKRFDLDADDFEQQVAAFVEQHVNGCNDCLQYHRYQKTE